MSVLPPGYVARGAVRPLALRPVRGGARGAEGPPEAVRPLRDSEALLLGRGASGTARPAVQVHLESTK